MGRISLPRWTFAALALAIVVLMPSPASRAGTLSNSFTPGNPWFATWNTTYTAAPGERNDMRVDGMVPLQPNQFGLHIPGAARFTDLEGITLDDSLSECAGALITYLCLYHGEQSFIPGENHVVTIALGDGDDKLRQRQIQTEAHRILESFADCPTKSDCLKIQSIDGGDGDDYIDVADGMSGGASVTCGPGDDVVEAEPRDVVAADCETVVRQSNSDLPTVGGYLTERIASHVGTRDYGYKGAEGVPNDVRVDIGLDAFGITDLEGISSSAFECQGALLRFNCLYDRYGGAPGQPADFIGIDLADGDDRYRQRSTEGPEATAAQSYVPCADPWGPCRFKAVAMGDGDDYADIRDGLALGTRLTCGPGIDVAYVDVGEAAGSDCETIVTGS